MQPATAILYSTLVVRGLLLIGGAHVVHSAIDDCIFPSALLLLIAHCRHQLRWVCVFNERFGTTHWM